MMRRVEASAEESLAATLLAGLEKGLVLLLSLDEGFFEQVGICVSCR